MTAKTQLSILTALSVQYDDVKIAAVNTMADLEALVARKPDMVVLGAKLVLLDTKLGYDESPKLWIGAYLDANNIPYTGSDAETLELGYDKPAAKRIVHTAGIDTSRFFISTAASPTYDHELSYPLFVKPADRWGSKGIDEDSFVANVKELKSKIDSIHQECDSDALIEEYLPGREFSVAVQRIPGSSELLATPIEITIPLDRKGHSYLSKSVKTTDVESTQPVTDHVLGKALSLCASNAFEALQARDYGRIDLRLDSKGRPNFIEANLMPGLSNHGYMYRCSSQNYSISYGDVILGIVALAFERVNSGIQLKASSLIEPLNVSIPDVLPSGSIGS